MTQGLEEKPAEKPAGGSAIEKPAGGSETSRRLKPTAG